ncbi:MAG: hypothetical protein EHM24_29335, partial [Acidobacteria bacterium]
MGDARGSLPAGLLLADRFWPDERGCVYDLATGERVSWKTFERREGPADRRLSRGLLDYGRLDRATGFEVHARRPGHRAARSYGRRLGEDLRSVEAIVFQVVDLIDNGRAGEPRAMAVSGPASTLRSVLGAVARASRLRGFVPLSARVLAGAAFGASGQLLEAIEGRHVLVIDWQERCRPAREFARQRSAVARFICRLGARSFRPHLLVSFRPGGHLLLTRRLESGVPAIETASLSRGLRLSAREEPAAYEVRPCRPLTSTAVSTVGCQSPLARALDRASHGRHAEAERSLRETIGWMARRGNEVGAASAALALGRLLLGRGRAGEARVQFDSARAAFDAAGSASGAVEAATGLGLALTDEARLLEAEAALRLAAFAAVTIGARREEAAARLALSRCLYWLERFEEAASEIASLASDKDQDAALMAAHGAADSPDTGLLARCLEARIALARHDSVRAAAAARAASCRAQSLGGPLASCVAHRAEAAVYASIGDTVHLQQHAGLGLDAARRAHAP